MILKWVKLPLPCWKALPITGLLYRATQSHGLGSEVSYLPTLNQLTMLLKQDKH